MANKKMKTIDFGNGDVYVNTPDWDKIDGRPFYKENQTFTVLPLQTVSFVDVEDGTYGNMLEITQDFVEGATVIVEYNGVSYTCECAMMPDMPDALFIGNMSFIGMDADTGEPFAIMHMSGVMTMMVTNLTAPASVEVGIDMETVVYHKLPFDYMPEEYGGIGVINMTVPQILNSSAAGLTCNVPVSKMIQAGADATARQLVINRSSTILNIEVIGNDAGQTGVNVTFLADMGGGQSHAAIYVLNVSYYGEGHSSNSAQVLGKLYDSSAS